MYFYDQCGNCKALCQLPCEYYNSSVQHVYSEAEYMQYARFSAMERSHVW